MKCIACLEDKNKLAICVNEPDGYTAMCMDCWFSLPFDDERKVQLAIYAVDCACAMAIKEEKNIKIKVQ